MSFGLEGEHERLDWLKPVLRRWGRLIDGYCAAHPRDVPYFYNERANVGVLAAAAWGGGGGSLEEYPCKRDGNGEGVRGRTDLYIYDKDNSATIEAKQVWWTPRSRVAAISAPLREAHAQAVTTREADVRVAAVFATLMLPADADVSSERERIRAVGKMHEAGMHLIAWAFPSDKREYRSNNDSGVECLWPGVVLGLRVAHRKLQ